MVKQNGINRTRNIISIVVGVLAIASVFAGVVLAWGGMGNTAKRVSVLKKDGCDPSNDNKFDIALMKKDVQAIQKTLVEAKIERKEMRDEHKDGVNLILERLPK